MLRDLSPEGSCVDYHDSRVCAYPLRTRCSQAEHTRERTQDSQQGVGNGKNSEQGSVPSKGATCDSASGLNEIITTFGDIREYVGSDGQLEARWQLDFLERVSLPFPLRLSWDPSRTITRMTCHRRMTGIFSSVFASIQERELQDRIASFGGCFAFRPQRTGSKLSTHSWGIAIDLNPESNPRDRRGTWTPGLLRFSAGPVSSGEAIGKARLEIPCIFNSALGIESRGAGAIQGLGQDGKSVFSF